MSVAAPPRPPRGSVPVDQEELEALVEALIEEARRRARRRRRRIGLAVLLVAGAGIAAFIGFGGHGGGGAGTAALAPLVGPKASTPTTGRMLLGLSPTETTQWNVYADGRIIWQKWSPSFDATVVPKGAKRLDTSYVQQRLTRQGVRLLRSKILATGLFEHNLMLKVGRGDAWVFHQVRRGDRIVTVNGQASPDPTWNEHFTKATPAQRRELASIAALVADPARWLPRRMWADRQIRAFVPARYVVGFDRGYPDLSKLPSPAGKALAQYKPLRQHACELLTTGQARALLQALVEAGITPNENHGWFINFDLGRLPGQPHPSGLHLSPARPDDRC
jgi:hypothetical protein